jgi:chorismate--pyruvate lyase
MFSLYIIGAFDESVYAIIFVVKIQPHYIKLRSNWLRKPLSTFKLKHWLVDEASLTLRLQLRYADFHVEPLYQQSEKPIADEADLLGFKLTKRMQVREVLLIGDNQPVVFAHSVLPASSLRGEWCQLGKLGNKPLGEALFKNPRVVRAPLSFKKLTFNDVLYQKAVKHLINPPVYLWARRSIFRLNCAKILVTEVFLPHICHE